MERGRSSSTQEDVSGSAGGGGRDYGAICGRNRLRRRPGNSGAEESRLDDVPFIVVGVTAEGILPGPNPLRNDIWTPLPARRLLRAE